jgi:hypothetical protein
MSSSKKLSATLAIALSAAVAALCGPASALDFNNPTDKRAYCEAFAQQAIADVKMGQLRGCALTGTTWSTNVQDHINWCMSQASMAAAMLESTNRSSIANQCAASASTANSMGTVVAATQAADPFPPVITDQSPATDPSTATPGTSTPQATNFPPVVTSTKAQASTATMPPVVASGASASQSRGSTSVVFRPAIRHEHVGDRLIEFEHQHKREIRHIARVLKEKLKDKLSDMKNHHKPDVQNFGGKLKKAFKSGFARRLANR